MLVLSHYPFSHQHKPLSLALSHSLSLHKKTIYSIHLKNGLVVFSISNDNDAFFIHAQNSQLRYLKRISLDKEEKKIIKENLRAIK